MSSSTVRMIKAMLRFHVRNKRSEVISCVLEIISVIAVSGLLAGKASFSVCLRGVHLS